jgi:hypothetical protein
MRASAVGALLARTGAAWQVVEGLLDVGELVSIEAEGERHFVRGFAGRHDLAA